MANDEKLTAQWEACALGRSISHEEHIRIARILIRRHGREEATRRLVEGTRRNCEAMTVPERFDEALTIQWSNRIADAVDASDEAGFEGFIRSHPELLRSDLLGLPAWKIRELRGD